MLIVFWAHALPGLNYFIPATLGVTAFFFLSGYLITTLLRREFETTGTLSIRDFYIRRTLRIFLPLYLVYALAAAGSHLLHQSSGNLLGLASVYLYFHNYAIALRAHAWVPLGMQVAWSLSVEEHFYLLFPLLYLAMVRRGLTAVKQTRLLIGFCILEMLWRVVLTLTLKPIGPWAYVATDARLDSIVWGCILAIRNNPMYFKTSISDRSILPARYEFVTFLSAIVLLIASLALRNHLYRWAFRPTVQALGLYVFFTFAIAHSQHAAVRWLAWPWLRYIGWASYVLYLVHDFVLSALFLRYAGHRWLVPIAGFALSLAFATLLRYTLELPLQRLRVRFRHVAETDPTAADGHGLIA